MQNEWYVKTRSGEQGPFTTAQLRRLYETGRIKETTAVKLGHGGDWALAKGALTKPPSHRESDPSSPEKPLIAVQTANEARKRKKPQFAAAWVAVASVGALLLFAILAGGIYFLVSAEPQTSPATPPPNSEPAQLASSTPSLEWVQEEGMDTCQVTDQDFMAIASVMPFPTSIADVWNAHVTTGDGTVSLGSWATIEKAKEVCEQRLLWMLATRDSANPGRPPVPEPDLDFRWVDSTTLLSVEDRIAQECQWNPDGFFPANGMVTPHYGNSKWSAHIIYPGGDEDLGDWETVERAKEACEVHLKLEWTLHRSG